MDQSAIDNKCDISIYVSWAGTDNEGKPLLDSGN